MSTKIFGAKGGGRTRTVSRLSTGRVYHLRHFRIGRDGEIRTHTEHGLSVLPLPVGLRPLKGELVGAGCESRTHTGRRFKHRASANWAKPASSRGSFFEKSETPNRPLTRAGSIGQIVGWKWCATFSLGGEIRSHMVSVNKFLSAARYERPF